ncbi:cyanobactin biosynthesis PatC/TenC/TruC family protein [Microcystis aeruginosa]|uniref:cyanobactin biosynthesis PatC/TenC/TruC family protein n=1 Tax=Microcystis aeruginosa TaxID=1126 RepID=UPI00232CC2F9|nr:cyanobactin biosynthesis PatC/TenC/TruC family protein [Microcystis aeruginosa]MDB9411871.1 cyanobactin biosynthesis PatC/TenC/TruC family protein [Microcystis aeruginosa CS-567/02]
MSYRYFDKIEMHPNYPYSSSFHTKTRRAKVRQNQQPLPRMLTNQPLKNPRLSNQKQLNPKLNNIPATGLEDYGRWKTMFKDRKANPNDPPFRRGRIWC